MVIRQNEPRKAQLELTAVLYALSDRTRLRIVAMLSTTSEMTCGEFEIAMPKSSLSHHFRVLRNAGIIATRKEGTTLLNRLREADLEDRFPGLLPSIRDASKKL